MATSPLSSRTFSLLPIRRIYSLRASAGVWLCSFSSSRSNGIGGAPPGGSADAPSLLAEEDKDPFNCLPDTLLLAVFNTLRDVKSLGHCCAVSNRFRFLALHADYVLVCIDDVISSSFNLSASPCSSRVPHNPFSSLPKPLSRWPRGTRAQGHAKSPLRSKHKGGNHMPCMANGSTH